MEKPSDIFYGLGFSANKIQAIKNKCKSEHIWYEDLVEDFHKKHMVMNLHLTDKDFRTFINAMADQFIETGEV